MKKRIYIIVLAVACIALGSLFGLSVGSAADKAANQASDGPILCTDQASCDALGNDNPPPVPDDEAGPGDGDEGEAPPVEESQDAPESAAPVPQPQPQTPKPQPSVPPVAPATQPKPQTPAPKTPKAATTVPAVPSGPPSFPDILIREFSGDWTGGPVTFHYYVSHASTCDLTYAGKKLTLTIDHSSSDNSQLDSREVRDFPVKGGKAGLLCRGIAPDPATKYAETTVRPAPTSTTQVTMTVQSKSKKGLKTKKKRPKTVKATVPVAPSEVSGSYQGWCGIRPDGTWGFSQSPFPGAQPALYKPGVGLNCDVGRYTKAEWKAYICKYFHCQDPTRRKK